MAGASDKALDLVGPKGVLTGLTKRVLVAGLEAEMTEHLGYDKHALEGRDGGSSRNGTRPKTVLTEVGPVPLDVPRDWDASFKQQRAKKRQRRLRGVDEMAISLTAKGLTTGEVKAHLVEVYGTDVSRQTVSKITDAILGEMSDWLNRPLKQVYAAVFIDAIVVKIRDGQVTNRPSYTPVGVTTDGTRSILGIWIGPGGEGAKFWLQVLTELANRGTSDVCIVVCDGLKVLPEAIQTTWPLAIVQTCVLHLVRNTFRIASRADWDATARGLRPVYTAPTEQVAKERVGEFNEIWEASTRRSPGCGRTPGPTSPRSWPTTPSSAGSSTRPTRSSRSTPGCAARPARRGTSPTTRPRASARRWSRAAWTRPGVVEGDG